VCACGPCAVCIVIAEYTFREYVFIFFCADATTRTFEGLRERTEHLDIFLFSAHHSVVFCFGRSVYWWKGSVIFIVLKVFLDSLVGF